MRTTRRNVPMIPAGDLAGMIERAADAAHDACKHVELNDDVARMVVEQLRWIATIRAERDMARAAHAKALAAIVAWRQNETPNMVMDLEKRTLERAPGKCRACDALDAKLKESA